MASEQPPIRGSVQPDAKWRPLNTSAGVGNLVTAPEQEEHGVHESDGIGEYEKNRNANVAAVRSIAASFLDPIARAATELFNRPSSKKCAVKRSFKSRLGVETRELRRSTRQAVAAKDTSKKVKGKFVSSTPPLTSSESDSESGGTSTSEYSDEREVESEYTCDNNTDEDVPPKVMPTKSSRTPQGLVDKRKFTGPSSSNTPSSFSADGDLPSSLPSSMKRNVRRKAKRVADKEKYKRRSEGNPKIQIHITPNGHVVQGVSGKNAFDDVLRSFCPRYLDYSCIFVANQPNHNLRSLRKRCHQEFEYINGKKLSKKGLKKKLTTFMKTERSTLKKIWEKNPAAESPMNIDADEWQSLKGYWEDEKTKEYAKRMSENRKLVKEPSRHGRLGKNGKANREAQGENRGEVPLNADISNGESENFLNLQSDMSSLMKKQANIASAMEIVMSRQEKVETCIDVVMSGMQDMKSMMLLLVGKENLKPCGNFHTNVTVGAPQIQRSSPTKDGSACEVQRDHVAHEHVEEEHNVLPGLSSRRSPVQQILSGSGIILKPTLEVGTRQRACKQKKGKTTVNKETSGPIFINSKQRGEGVLSAAKRRKTSSGHKFAREDIVDLLHPEMDGESAPIIARARVSGLPECNDKLHGKEIPENMVIVEIRQVRDEHSRVELYWPDNNDDPPQLYLEAGIRTVWLQKKLVLYSKK